MSLRKGLTSIAMFSSFSALAADFGNGYVSWVYLNDPLEYVGPGNIVECQKISTYQGGPKTGLWRVYYICLIEE